MTDVVELIKSQHRMIDDLLVQAEAAEPDQLPGLLRHVAELLTPHSKAEESFVYPAIREYDRSEADDVRDGLAEHHHVEGLMNELLEEDPSDPGFDGKLAAMIGELRHHVAEEESTLLPVLSEQADDDERDELGARFAEATGALESPSGERGPAPAAEKAKAGEKAQPVAKEKVGEKAQAVEKTRDELYQEAKDRGVPGRSGMSKDELARALDAEQ
jgi:hemerythrin superfamily protein